MVVVLPAPFGPSRPKHSPARTSRSRPSTATTSLYALRRPRTLSAGCPGIGGMIQYVPQPVSYAICNSGDNGPFAIAGAARATIFRSAPTGLATGVVLAAFVIFNLSSFRQELRPMLQL